MKISAFHFAIMPRFLSKTYEMVEDPSSNAIISWSATNRSFIVWDETLFTKDVMHNYFKHKNFSTFVRQLNTYGFRKVGEVRWEFANENFVRGEPGLMKNITRRKAVHSRRSPQNLIRQMEAPLAESERQCLKAEIEKLKQEKQQLLREFQRNELKWKMQEMYFYSSKDRLEKLEQKQQTVLSSISQVLHKPELAINLGSLKENKARIGDPIETSQMLLGYNAGIAFSSDMLRMNLLESSMMFVENAVHNVGGTSHQRHSNKDLIESIEVQPKSSESVIIIPDPVAPIEEPAGTAKAQPVNSPFWQQFFT